MNQAAILVVEDDVSLREALCDTLNLAGYRADGARDGLAALERMGNAPYAMVVSDIKMGAMDGNVLLKNIKTKYPEVPVLLMTAYGTVQNAVQAMHDGAEDYLVKPIEAEVLISMVQRIVSSHAQECSEFIAADPRTREVQSVAQRVAESDATVLITGESGVGKEVLARYIHSCSKRATAPFIAINCAAIPENMLEATLFGYEKGAFTGAIKSCPGKFEQAQGGTLLLDEISEMDLGLQAKLLRVLQEREVERIGGNKLIALDVRVLATSNRVMRDEVAAGRFREDLFYRLNVFPIELPPLRERPLDIVPLAQRCLERSAKAYGHKIPALSAEAQEKLTGHRWTGNVRELDNAMQRALILHSGNEITSRDLRFEYHDAVTPTVAPSTTTAPVAKPEPTGAISGTLQDELRRREAEQIVAVLKEHMGSRKAAASTLGVSERTLRYKIARMRDAGFAIP